MNLKNLKVLVDDYIPKPIDPETVSKISGRGVGMDVFRNHIDELGGMISFKTECNGTTFTFRIPLASAVLLVSFSSARQNRLDMQLKTIGISTVKTGNIGETIEAADKKEFVEDTSRQIEKQ